MEDLQFTGWFWVHFLYSDLMLIAVILCLGYYVLRVDRSLMDGIRWMLAISEVINIAAKG